MDTNKIKAFVFVALVLAVGAGSLVSCLHNKTKDTSRTAGHAVLSAKMQETTPNVVDPPAPAKEEFELYKNPDGAQFKLRSGTQKIVYQGGKFSDELPNNGEAVFVEFHLKNEKWGFPVPQQAMLLLQSMQKTSDKLSPYSAINAIRMCQKHPSKASCHRYAAQILAKAHNGIEE